MEASRTMERLLKDFNYALHEYNRTLDRLQGLTDRLQGNGTISRRDHKDDNAYIFIIFVMFLFAVTVGSLVLGYTRSKNKDKSKDPYHVYIKNSGVSII